MAVSLRLRFEIFKRDDFRCKYCGRSSPEAVLEVDHVIPVSDGGTDDPANIVTACWECNRGKHGDRLDGLPRRNHRVHPSTRETLLALESSAELDMTVLECVLCGHAWHPRRPVMPKICPACKSTKYSTQVQHG